MAQQNRANPLHFSLASGSRLCFFISIFLVCRWLPMTSATADTGYPHGACRALGHTPSVLNRHSWLLNGQFSGRCGESIPLQYESRRFNGRRPDDPSDAPLRACSIAILSLGLDDSRADAVRVFYFSTNLVDSIAATQQSRQTRRSERARSLF